MKTARFRDAQIMGILKQAEGGTPVSELCREHGKSSASFYKWRAKFGGMIAQSRNVTLGAYDLVHNAYRVELDGQSMRKTKLKTGDESAQS
jgi:transposase-like protein